jgi:hypothetical protein
LTAYYDRRRKQYGGLKTNRAERLEERENARMKPPLAGDAGTVPERLARVVL